MADNDFQYIQLLILNNVHFGYVSYTLILDHLDNFPITTIFSVI